jgi:hypothetical protein
MIQNYGTTYAGLSVVMSQAEKLRNGQDLTPSDYRELVAQFGGQVPPERLARLMNAVDAAGDSNSRARAYLKDLIQDTQKHRLGESYKLLDNYSQLNAQQLVDERMAERAEKESEWDRAQGKDKIKPFSEWDPSAMNSTAHQRHVRANIEEALDEHYAQKPMSQNTRLGVLVDAKYGDSNIGDISDNRQTPFGPFNGHRKNKGFSRPLGLAHLCLKCRRIIYGKANILMTAQIRKRCRWRHQPKQSRKTVWRLNSPVALHHDRKCRSGFQQPSEPRHLN